MSLGFLHKAWNLVSVFYNYLFYSFIWVGVTSYDLLSENSSMSTLQCERFSVHRFSLKTLYYPLLWGWIMSPKKICWSLTSGTCTRDLIWKQDHCRCNWWWWCHPELGRALIQWWCPQKTREIWTHINRGELCGDGGRDWHDASAIRECLESQKQEKQGGIFPQSFQKEALQTPWLQTSGLQASLLWDNTFLLL